MSDDLVPEMLVTVAIHNDQDPALVQITTEGSGRLRVMLNGLTVLFDGEPAE